MTMTPDNTHELIADTRKHAKFLREVWSDDAEIRDDTRRFDHLAEALEAAETERDAALEAIERVRAIHPPVECDRHEGCPPSCEICLDDWPCATIQALGTNEGESK